MRADATLPMATLMTPIRDDAELHNPNVVKVVTDVDGHALYFSRAPIPHWRDGRAGGAAARPGDTSGCTLTGASSCCDSRAWHRPPWSGGEAGATARSRAWLSHCGRRGGGCGAGGGHARGSRYGASVDRVAAEGDVMSETNRAKTKFIFVTGGVVSSLGKGLASASIGALLESRGLNVTILKMDPYINVDPGTMSPFQHGEVFVTDDGAETDLDLGHYERFLSVRMSQKNNFTTGRSTTR
jgi:hypothetical protein